jgi:mannose-6-phosphate isomerase-like protein (cupin superfamily)
MAGKKNIKAADVPVIGAFEYEPLVNANSPEYENFYRELSGRGDGDMLLHPDKNPGGYTVVRKNDAREVRRATPVSVRNPEHEYRQLAGSRAKKHMRSFVITLKGESRKSAYASHRGEEFILVQKGAVRVYLGESQEVLREGDSVYYLSTIPHRIENIGSGPSVILAVIYGS